MSDSTVMVSSVVELADEIISAIIKNVQAGQTLTLVVQENVSKVYLLGIKEKSDIRDFNKYLAGEVGKERYSKNKAVVSKVWKCLDYFCTQLEDSSLAEVWADGEGPNLLEMYQKIPGKKGKLTTMQKMEKLLSRLSIGQLNQVAEMADSLANERRNANEKAKAQNERRLADLREMIGPKLQVA